MLTVEIQNKSSSLVVRSCTALGGTRRQWHFFSLSMSRATRSWQGTNRKYLNSWTAWRKATHGNLNVSQLQASPEKLHLDFPTFTLNKIRDTDFAIYSRICPVLIRWLAKQTSKMKDWLERPQSTFEKLFCKRNRVNRGIDYLPFQCGRSSETRRAKPKSATLISAPISLLVSNRFSG